MSTTIGQLRKRIKLEEKRRVPAQETEANRKLRARFVAARRRMTEFPSDSLDPLPPLAAEALLGKSKQDIILLHLQRGRERNHLLRGEIE